MSRDKFDSATLVPTHTEGLTTDGLATDGLATDGLTTDSVGGVVPAPDQTHAPAARGRTGRAPREGRGHGQVEGRLLDDGRFELVDVIGEGGMAVVARAWDHRDGAWRAVKLLAPVLNAYPAVVARFQREAQVLGRLGHPGLVKVHAVGRDPTYHWLVMDLVDGHNLDQVVREGGASVPLAVDAVVGICAALEVAHDAGVVHRDVKPANAAVDGMGQVRLLDFGIARLADAEVSLTRTGRTMGSHGFMAPEQLEDAKHVDARADVYAAATTLLALLLGRNPRPGEDMLHAAQGMAPDDLLVAVARATATAPEHRTPTIGRLSRQLSRVRQTLDDTGPLTALHRALPTTAPPGR